MSPESDVHAKLLQLQQELREAERKHDEDIKDIRNAYEQGRREAALALAAFMTVEVHKLSIENMKLFIATSLKDAEKPVVDQGQQLAQLRKDFDAYVQGQKDQADASIAQKNTHASHRWTVLGGILGMIALAFSILTWLYNWFTTHMLYH